MNVEDLLFVSIVDEDFVTETFHCSGNRTRETVKARMETSFCDISLDLQAHFLSLSERLEIPAEGDFTSFTDRLLNFKLAFPVRRTDAFYHLLLGLSGHL